jgi:hypothetical protein
MEAADEQNLNERSKSLFFAANCNSGGANP